MSQLGSIEEVSTTELEEKINPDDVITLSEGEVTSDDEDDDESVSAQQLTTSEDPEDLLYDREEFEAHKKAQKESKEEERETPQETPQNVIIKGDTEATKNPTAEFVVSEDEASSSEESDDVPEDIESLQKLEQELNKEILLKYHPESVFSNYNEVLAQCKIVRNKQGEIIDPLHTTIPFLTKYEKARIIGVRAKQLNNGAQAFVNLPNTIIDGILIAEKELEEKKIPFIIRRPLPNGGSEYWRVSDLEILEF